MRKIFGNVSLGHGYCPKCKSPAFLDAAGRCLDCWTEAEAGPERTTVRVSSGQYFRKQPTAKRKKALLRAQENKCYWCGSEFGDIATSRSGGFYVLTPVFDHIVPYVFTGCNDEMELVAACSICNRYKNSQIFETEDECRAYIRRRIRRRWIMPSAGGTNGQAVPR